MWLCVHSKSLSLCRHFNDLLLTIDDTATLKARVLKRLVYSVYFFGIA
ncbi:hypothetical protein VpaChn25_A1258 [Vibrio parahaemolyticus]|nr:hypothetical protein VpaChn25_A1258 [Vibrio parahaemolyticus]AWG85894.1 hypothetical protein Vp2S01_A0409 [Vibrio parahaemolyticus]ETT18110.1 hypothetical protein D028_0830 [Vibrio parahaemolyticus 50]EVU08774.1 hypothetical protein D018_1016 [Vibrio parahaemolyticus VP2007-007]EXJ45782.1 hypothetical protein D049_1561 [Vibrio parahaemolyticus VPTS-2010]